MKQFLFSFSLLLICAPSLFAETGYLRGNVMNSQGSVLSGSRIQLIDAGGKVVEDATTDAAGEFSLHVPLGQYRLTVDAGGSGKAERLVRVVPGVSFLSIPITETPVGRRTLGINLQSAANLSAILVDNELLQTLSDDPAELATVLGGGTSFASGTTGTNLGAPLVSQGGSPIGGGSAGGIGGGGQSAVIGGTLTTSSVSFVNQPRITGPRVSLTGSEFVGDGMPGRLPPKDQIQEAWIDTDLFTTEYHTPGFSRIHINTLVRDRGFHGIAAFNFRDESMDSPLPFFFFNRAYQSRYFHGEAGGSILPDKLFASLSAQRLGQDRGRNLVSAVTPNGPVNLEAPNGTADQIFSGRSHYQISQRHSLNVNARYRTQVMPNIGVGGNSLPEQAFETTNRGWDLQVRETAFLSPRLLHETRFQTLRDTTHSRAVHEGTAVTVFSAFTGGGTSGVTRSNATQTRLEDLLVWSTPRWTLRSGLQGERIATDLYTKGQTLGSFTFSSLQDFAASRPFSYSQSLTETRRESRQYELGAFVHGEWPVSPKLYVSGGARYENQTNLEDHNNIDPRVAFAYQLASGVALRGGAAIFHHRFSLSDATTLAYGTGEQIPVFLTISNPSYPNPAVTNATTFFFTNSLLFRDPNLAAPYSAISSLSIEKIFDSGHLASATIDVIRGIRQIRVRNINAPYLQGLDPAILNTLTATEINQRRPFYPDTRAISQYESVGFLTSRNLTLRFSAPEQRVWKVGLRTMGGYTLGSSEDDDGVAVDNYDRRAEWGRTSLYTRHHIWSAAILRAPWGISLAGLLQAHSGFPRSVLALTDTNRDGNFNDRAPGTSRNSIDGPNVFNFDLKASKTMKLHRVTTTLFVYGQNVFNSRNYTIFSSPTSFSGGFPSNPSTRRMELGLRLQF